MLSAEVIIMQYVCPGLGLIIATMMFFAPYRDLQHAIERGHLGTLNPTPWVFMFGNCLGWVVYSTLKRDFWLLFSNGPGLVLSVWLNFGAIKLLYQGHFSTEMRRSFAAYLEEEAKKDEENPEVSAPSKATHRPQRSLVDIVSDIFSNDDQGKGTPSESSEDGPVVNDVSDDPPNGATVENDEPSTAENIVDAVAEIFTGPVYGAGHRRTLSMEVAAEAFIGGAVLETMPNAESGDAPAVLERVPFESAFGAPIEGPMDFFKVVLDVTSQTTPAPAPHEHVLLGNVVLWVAVLCLVFFADSFSENTKILIVGVFTNLNLVFFYGAPLSTIAVVVAENKSDSIHVPTMITNTMSSTFWMIYGLAITDWFVAAPNGLGTLLGAAQIALYLVYPRTGRVEKVKGNGSRKKRRPGLKKKKSSSIRVIEELSSITPVEKLIKDIETPLIPSPAGFMQPPPSIPETKPLVENRVTRA